MKIVDESRWEQISAPGGYFGVYEGPGGVLGYFSIFGEDAGVVSDMKKKMLTIAAGFILWLSALPATAQEDVRPVPSWVSERGYWVVEHAVGTTVVYFYNNDNTLVYKQRVQGSLNTDRKKIKLKLTRELEQAVTAWERGKPMGDGQVVVK